MRKAITLSIISILCVFSAIAELKIEPSSFRDINSSDRQTEGMSLGSQNMLSSSISWPYDADGNDDVALLLISFKNVPYTEIGKFNISTKLYPMPSTPKEVVEIDSRQYFKVFIPAHKKMDLDFSHPEYGVTRLTGKDILKHHIYQLTISNDKLINIVVTSDPDGAQVILDGSPRGATPITINNVTMGKHEISLIAQHKNIAQDVPTTFIEISDAAQRFDFPMRKRKSVTISSDPKGANIQIVKDGTMIQKGKSPLSVNLEYGEYIINAQLNNTEIHEPISINGATSSEITVKVIDSKPITIHATQNNYNVDAQISIDGGAQIGKSNSSFLVSYGRHSVDASYYGYHKTKRINVDRNSESDITIKLPNRHRSYHNPFDTDYNKRDWGMAFNYINRHYSFNFNGHSQRFSTWNEGGSDHGIQMGVSYHPYFGFGQGLVTGIYWQMFFEEPGDIDGDPMWFDHALYIPLQYQFRLPLGEDFSIYVNAGIGMTLGLSNSLSWGSDYDNESIELGYGYNEEYETYMPDRVQWSIPVGAGIQYKAFALDFKYSFGLNKNGVMFEEEEGEKAAYKMSTWQLGFAIVF